MGITAWEDRLSELADYRKIQGTAMFLKTKKHHWLVNNQRSNYRLHQKERHRHDLPYPGIEGRVWGFQSLPGKTV
jgi:hypothetical protein